MDELVVLGTVLTVDADRRTHARGAVYIHDGVIERVADATAAPRPPVMKRRRGCASTVWSHPDSSTCTTTSPTTPCRCGSAGPRPTARATSGRAPRRTAPTCRIPRRRWASPHPPPRSASPRSRRPSAVSPRSKAHRRSRERSRAGWCATSRTRSTAPVRRIFQSVLPATDKQLDSTATHLADGRGVLLPPRRRRRRVAARRVHAPRRSPLRPRRTRRHPLDGAH